jgi:hypothetical protein
MVFCEELGIDSALEFDVSDDTSRHVLAKGKHIYCDFRMIALISIMLVGDAPVGCARWRLRPGDAVGSNEAIIDRLCVLHDYRRRAFGKLCFEHVMQASAFVRGTLQRT